LLDLLERLRIFVQNFNTNCPSRCAIRQCENIAEMFHLLVLRTAHERYRQATDRRQTDGPCHKPNARGYIYLKTNKFKTNALEAINKLKL